MSQADYKHGGPMEIEHIYFAEDVAMEIGVGVCYEHNHAASGQVPAQAATDAYAGRRRRVKLPTTSINRAFAGVLISKKAAQTGGQEGIIAKPGSVCMIRTGKNTVLDTTILTASVNAADKGMFTHEGFVGRGSALALQTTGNILERHIDGAATLDATGLILTEAGAQFVTNGIAAGDRVKIPAGTAGVVTPGEYLVASVTSETVLVLATAAASGAAVCNFYIEQAGSENLCLAYLYDGPESGLQEELSPASGATQSMVGGMTYIAGGYAPGGNATSTLADGTRNQELKGFKTLGTVGTQDYVVTVTSGLQLDGSALATVSLDTAGESAALQWQLDEWRALTVHGAAQA